MALLPKVLSRLKLPYVVFSVVTLSNSVSVFVFYAHIDLNSSNHTKYFKYIYVRTNEHLEGVYTFSCLLVYNTSSIYTFTHAYTHTNSHM